MVDQSKQISKDLEATTLKVTCSRTVFVNDWYNSTSLLKLTKFCYIHRSICFVNIALSRSLLRPIVICFDTLLSFTYAFCTVALSCGHANCSNVQGSDWFLIIYSVLFVLRYQYFFLVIKISYSFEPLHPRVAPAIYNFPLCVFRTFILRYCIPI